MAEKMKKSKREIELKKGCGEDFCGKLIFYKDKTTEDTLCPKCKAELKGIREERKRISKKIENFSADIYVMLQYQETMLCNCEENRKQEGIHNDDCNFIEVQEKLEELKKEILK